MPKPTIVFLVNGEPGSAMAVRASAFAERLADEFDIEIAYRSGNKIAAIFRFWRRLTQLRPRVCYIFDMAYSGVIAAACYRLFSRCLTVVDTGDAIYELSRSTGNRSRLGLWLTQLLEWGGYRIADRVVVRSHPHRDLLAVRGIQADVVPDGVDIAEFTPCVVDDLRKQYGLDGYTVIGVLGSLVWSPRLEMCYGWELIEMIHRLRDRPVKGVIIGDGSGLAWLKQRCAALQIEDRIVFVGRLPYRQLSRFISLMDICLSTQTNDIPGRVRTTGKLPIYLACGRFVLASQVGEAAIVLPPEMLVPYNGVKDIEYPARLAARVEVLLDHPETLQLSRYSTVLAKKYFDYNVLAARLRETLRILLDVPGGSGEISHDEPASSVNLLGPR